VSQPPNTLFQPPEGGPGLKIPILFGIVIALAAANVYLFLQVDQVKTEMSKNRETLLTEISNLRETATISTQTSRRHVESLKADLDAARRRAEAAAGEAKQEALRQVADLEGKVQRENKRAAEQVKAELGRVEQTALDATSKVNATLSDDIGSVKKEVAISKSELDKTIENLKKVTGDLGVQSGLIATNSGELAALKALGERSYFEFNLVKSKQPVKISDITLLLKSADLKRNRYTIELVADDKRVEKRDKSINEPVQFLMSKYRQPCELVVNEIKKDRIVGYLSQPKVLAPRTAN